MARRPSYASSGYDDQLEQSAAALAKVATGGKMKFIWAIIAAIVLISMVGCAGTTIPSGYVGVRVINQALPGFQAGVQPNELGVGWHPPIWGSEVKRFPTTVNTVVWADGDAAATVQVGSRYRTEIIGPSMSFVVGDRIRVGLPVALQVSTVGARASDLVQTYRFGFDELVSGPVQRELQEAFTRIGPRFTSDQIINDGGAALADAVETELRPIFNELGVNLQGLNVVGAPVMPAEIQERITALVEARQNTLLQQERVAVVEAEAQQRIAAAHGRAEALRIEGEALRQNPSIARLREIERWNGQCPLDAEICAPGNAAAVQGNRQ